VHLRPDDLTMATATLDFERPLLELERQIDELKSAWRARRVDATKELAPLEKRLAELRTEIYKNLTPMQRVQWPATQATVLARLPEHGVHDFVEAARRPAFRDDPAIVGGWARLDGMSVMVSGTRRPRYQGEPVPQLRMAHPEGYRKALRLMHLPSSSRPRHHPGGYAGAYPARRRKSEARPRRSRAISWRCDPAHADHHRRDR